MIVLIKKKWITLAESWYAGEELRRSPPRADLVFYFQSPEPIAGTVSAPFETLITDLTQSEEKLFASISKGARYEIRRAEDRDGLQYEHWPSPSAALVGEFHAFFSTFARAMHLGIPKLSRLETYRVADSLWLSRISLIGGATLCWHAYVMAHGRGRLLHSASLRAGLSTEMKNIVGRANRLQHWKDMVEMKRGGVELFDFGGWYTGNSDRQRLNINQFKEQFGGTHEITYNGELSLTIRGKLYTGLKSLLAKRHQKRVEPAPESQISDQSEKAAS